MWVKTRLSSCFLTRTFAPKEIEGVCYFTGSGRLSGNCRGCLSGFGLTDSEADLQCNSNLKAFIPTINMKEEGSDSNLITVGKCFSLFQCDQVPIESS
jgi:hypothetical protein